MSTLGAILAGGRSQRFGSDKAQAIWRGQPLLHHVLEAIRPYVDAIIVCGREWPGETAIPDRPEPSLGPLGGLNAALAYGAEHDFDRVLSVPCDVPAIPPPLVQRLVACDRPAVVAALPVIGIWPMTLAAALDRHLAIDGARSMRGWACAVAAEQLEVAAADLPRNVNYLHDLSQLDA